ncbi:MAG: hypothetical protein IJV25_05775 [Prevotella sp.]|nr:hypothetical protein [Prevotella sp.]
MEANNRRYGDTALCEALGRISNQTRQEPLPEDFEQQVMNRRAGKKSSRRWMLVAAVFIGVLMLSGISFAAWQLRNQGAVKTSSSETHNVATLQKNETRDSIVHFDNVRLDSVLTIVGKHYGRIVIFHNEQSRHIHLYTKWDTTAPLNQIIDRLNDFEKVSIRLTDNQIISE